jgi:site-specific DNA recombinase
MNEKHPSAMIYARVSSEEQGRGYSIPTQIEACRRYCDDHGYAVIDEYTDMHTGTELDRPGVSALIEAVGISKPEVIVLYDVDRLGREVAVQAILEQDLTRFGARVEYTLGGSTATAGGELLKLVKGAIAVYENRQRVERSRRGKIGRVKAGYPLLPVNRAPFGYDYISEPHKGKLVINDEEAEIVRKMFHWLTIERVSSYKIAQRLWEMGVPSRGDKSAVVAKKTGHAEWSPSTVRKIFTNPAYKGEWYYGKRKRVSMGGTVKQVPVDPSEWVKIDIPAIVDAATWDEAQRCLTENKQRASRNAKRTYLLRGMVFCPCGRRWVGRYKNHLDRAYYRCPSTEAEFWREKCSSRFGIRQEILEGAVWNAVVEFLSRPEALLAGIRKRREQDASESKKRSQRLTSIERALANVDGKLGQLLMKELDGYPQEIINRQKDELIKQRQDLQAEQQRLALERQEQEITDDTEAMLRDLAATVETVIPTMLDEEKRRLLEVLKVRVEVIDQTHIKLSGIITGSIVDLTCLSAR